jgi:hypothetical protein
MPLQTVYDSELVYYRINPDDEDEECTDHPPITLGDFIKKTLPFEWSDSWANTPNGIESLKSGAVAIRTYALSAYHSAGVVNVGGQDYRCLKAWRTRINFHNDEPIDNIIRDYPNSVAAVDATNGIYLTHSNATPLLEINAIDPQFRDENGWYTATGDYPWLKQIYDPISLDASGAHSDPQGMGQHGSRRWAWGLDDDSRAYPQWDFRRILAHYYTGVTFVGVSPDPPEGYRNNIVSISAVPPNGGFTMEKGETRSGLTLFYQNTGEWNWSTTNTDNPYECPETEPAEGWQTLLSYHLYRQNGDGTTELACGAENCLGIRRSPICRYSSSPVAPGDVLWVGDFELFIPDDPNIAENETYLLRFDVEHRNDGIWSGYSTDFSWPAQDIPVYIVPPPDFTPPTNPGLFASRDGVHTANVWASDDTIEAEWEGASDDQSGVYGYSLEWTSVADTVPDPIVDVTVNQIDSLALNDGSWWLHIRTRDNAGNWANEATHFGPFPIDSTPPTATIEASTWVVTNTFPITLSGSDDFGLAYSGIISFALDYQINEGNWQDWLTTTTSGTLTFDQGGSPDDIIKLRACAYDLAGNPTGTCSYGYGNTQIRTKPYLFVEPANLDQCLIYSDTTPVGGNIQIINDGPETLVWTATVGISPTLITLGYTNGATVFGNPATIPYTIAHSGFITETSGAITITGASDVRNSPTILPVKIRVVETDDECSSDSIYLPLVLKDST